MSYLAIPTTPGSNDAFGRFRVSEAQSLFDSKLIADNDPAHWDDQQTSGGGTTSTWNANQSSVTLAVSNTTAGQRVRQTFRRFSYQPGKSQLINMTGVIGAAATGITRRIGVFDASNGMFFESGPTNIGVVVRTFTSGSAVDNRVAQSLWNYDKMDGTGPSGVTLDFSKTQIFVIDYQWLGVGRIRFGFVVAGVYCFAHASDHANLDTLVYTATPNLPLRFEINNSGAGGVASMLQICASVMSESTQDMTGQVRAVSRNTTPLVTANDTNLYPLFAIRVRSGYESANVRPINADIICTSAANIEMQLLLNPTVAGTALSFAAASGNSVVEAATGALNATTVSGGTVLGCAQASASIQQVGLVQAQDFQLGVNIAGVRDILVLAVRRLTGTTETFYGTLGWRESM